MLAQFVLRRLAVRCKLAIFLFVLVGASLPAAAAEPLHIGGRLEPMVDDWLINEMIGVTLQLHSPTPREVAIVYDAPWEGNISAYVTVFRDGDLFRMYYRGGDANPMTGVATAQRVCYAESTDGITWTKPELGLIEFDGSKKNNLIWDGVGNHNFTPFKDANPDCEPEARYKAVGSGKGGLVAFQSADALHWSLIRPEPVITKGAFDSQNLAFYDTFRKRYVDFHRGALEGIRHIMTCTSSDFVNWTEPGWVDFGKAPKEHLYTNAITPYFRAPHIFLGFPKRFNPSRKRGEHKYPGVSDGVFMTSRDGVIWNRWTEAFIRPGPQKSRWINRNNMTAWGVLATKSGIPDTPDELSIYSSEGYYVGPCQMRRYTLRMDGFVSVHASYTGGEMITKPIVFTGNRLHLNFATSAVGSVKVELQDAAGKPIDGFTLSQAVEHYGDELAQLAGWKGGQDVGRLAGKPVRVRFVMKDADLYALRFVKE